MHALRLFIIVALSSYLITGYCDQPEDIQATPPITATTSPKPADTLGYFIKEHLLGYWVRIKDISATPVWFANISPTRYAHHRIYICGAGVDYAVLCYPNGVFYSVYPTSDIRLGGLYTDPWYSVDICKAGYPCSPPR